MKILLYSPENVPKQIQLKLRFPLFWLYLYDTAASNNPPADTFSYIYFFILAIIGVAGGALSGLIIEAALPRPRHVQRRRCNYTATCGKSGWCLQGDWEDGRAMSGQGEWVEGGDGGALMRPLSERIRGKNVFFFPASWKLFSGSTDIHYKLLRKWKSLGGFGRMEEHPLARAEKSG